MAQNVAGPQAKIRGMVAFAATVAVVVAGSEKRRSSTTEPSLTT